MVKKIQGKDAGEELIKKEIISREDLDRARAHEKKTGMPWYRQLIQMEKVSFGALDDVLRYEFHPKAKRDEHFSLGESLVSSGEITEEALDEALMLQKRNGRLLGNILVENGFVNQDAMLRVLAHQYDLDYALIEDTPSEEEALHAMPEGMARKNELIPVSLEGDRLTVLIDSPHRRG
jgi:hypothetical protein